MKERINLTRLRSSFSAHAHNKLKLETTIFLNNFESETLVSGDRLLFFSVFIMFLILFKILSLRNCLSIILKLNCSSPHAYRIHLRITARWKHLTMYILPVTIMAIVVNIPLFVNLQVKNHKPIY